MKKSKKTSAPLIGRLCIDVIPPNPSHLTPRLLAIPLPKGAECSAAMVLA